MMGEFVHKAGSFSLFKHDKKGNEKAPDYTGDGTDHYGHPIRVAAWIKEGKKGKFMSGRYEPKEPPKPAEQPAPEPKGNPHFADMTDDIPF